ncbi:hypothetical protein MBCUT_17620 [Methanobrevibacter cuticularis]|uniref:Succinylglutamate desuccinylase / aspartoacylase family protein n=1 Tax=Methanobrevibacter cuticularis TaxID=47311 RepID=A0A166CZX0_9EURY|nr:hypothetical protein [Methanobrevibacter cuticularis]KZX15052.1 hypothetical protein MBCUT_17620 [Methanobrevibacter cuticularis]
MFNENKNSNGKKRYLALILISLIAMLLAISIMGTVNAVDKKSLVFDKKLLGKNNKGYVQLIKLGNKNSKVKVAYIIGIHPLENAVHKSFYKNLLAKNGKLKYSYYVYKVVVTRNPKNYGAGRMNGQLLANKFILPHAKRSKYNLLIDVHANVGSVSAGYGKKNFLFAPLNSVKSKKIAIKIIRKIKGLHYSYPSSQTSPKYITNPLVRFGVKTIIFETYTYQSNKKINRLTKSLINVVDGLF